MEADLDSIAPEGSGVAVRWARAKVAALQDGLLAGADAESVRSAVVETALAFGLVTRYTSLVAVEEFSSAEGPSRTARVPSALPAGSHVLSTLPQGGTWEPFRRRIGILLLVAGALLGLAAWRGKP
jgi:Ca-activated chloride channel family protein